MLDDTRIDLASLELTKLTWRFHRSVRISKFLLETSYGEMTCLPIEGDA